MSTIVTRSGKGSPLTNTEVDSNFTNLNSDKLEKSGGTMTGHLTIEDSVLEVGDKSGNNYLEIQHHTSDTKGFSTQYGNMSAFSNLQGSINQHIILGDTAGNNANTLFGVSIDDNGTLSKKLNLTGTGVLYVGSSGTTRVLTTADEGTGNGLDADTVDGLEASQFLRSDQADTTTKSLTVNGLLKTNTADSSADGLNIENTGGAIVNQYFSGSASTDEFVITRSGTGGAEFRINSSGAVRLGHAGDGVKLETTSTGLSVTGEIDMGTNAITDSRVGNWNTAYGWGDHASAGYQDGTYVDGIAYENNATLSRSVGDGQQWVKICDTATGQPQRIYLKVTHTGDNTNCEFEAEISTSGYGLPDHILVKNHQKYNNPIVSAIRTHQASSADVEVWIQVEDLSTSNGSLIVRSNKAIPTLTAISTEPTWSNSKIVYTNTASTSYEIIPSSGIMFQDNVKATFGTGEDLQIYHDGSHSYIKEVGTGNLRFDADNWYVRSADGSEAKIAAITNGAVSLYYDGTVKLATTSSGVTVTGGVTTTGAALMSTYRSSWTTEPTHDVLYNGWNSSISDYIFLKAAGNNSSGHGQLIVADQGIYFGQTNGETGTSVVDSATSPCDGANYGYVNSDGFKSSKFVATGTATIGGINGTFTNGYVQAINGSAIAALDSNELMFNTTGYVGSSSTLNLQSGSGVLLQHNGSTKLTTNSSGVDVNGLLSATTKSFVIDHPTKDGFKLRHGSLEGPENGVYVRGRTQANIIELPDYWDGLVDEDSVTINITPIGRDQGIYVESWDNQRVVLAGTAIDCFYTIYGERKDVDAFEVEYEE